MNHSPLRQNDLKREGDPTNLAKPVILSNPTIADGQVVWDKLQSIPLPFYSSKAYAGFPSADDYIENPLHLNILFIAHPAATFFSKAIRPLMISAGIHENDLLIVDRSLKARPGQIVTVGLNNELTVNNLFSRHGQVTLVTENAASKPINLTENE